MKLALGGTGGTLAAIGFLIAAAALTVALAGHGSRVAPPVPEGLVDRICTVESEVDELRSAHERSEKGSEMQALARRMASLEREVRALRRELATARSVGKRPASASKEAQEKVAGADSKGPESGKWPLVARKLTVDLWLDEGQRDVVDAALEVCDNVHRMALQEGEWRRRDLLSRSARRAAYRKVTAALRDDQKKLFDDWLKAPKNSELAAWFSRVKPCGGCGKKKTPRRTPKPTSKTEAKQ